MLLIANLALILLIVLMIIGLVKVLKRIFRFRVSAKEYEAMAKQVRALQRDLLRANYEKDKLLEMRVAELGGGSHELPIGEPEDEAEEEAANLPEIESDTELTEVTDEETTEENITEENE